MWAGQKSTTSSYYKYRWRCCKSQARLPAHHFAQGLLPPTHSQLRLIVSLDRVDLLRIAAKFTTKDTMKELVNKQSSFDGNTILHQATSSLDMVSELLRLGADPSIRNRQNQSPIQQAQKVDVMAALLEALLRVRVYHHASFLDLWEALSQDQPPEGRVNLQTQGRVILFLSTASGAANDAEKFASAMSSAGLLGGSLKISIIDVPIVNATELEDTSLTGSYIGFYADGEEHRTIPVDSSVTDQVQEFKDYLSLPVIPQEPLEGAQPRSRHPIPHKLPEGVCLYRKEDLRQPETQLRLGDGGSASVQLRVLDEELVAVKKFRIAGNYPEVKAHLLKQFFWEVHTLHTLVHPAVATMKGVVIDELKECYMIVLTYYKGKNLQNWLENNHVRLLEGKHMFSLEDSRRLATEMLDVVLFLHKANIIHRDIKPSNFLLKDEDGKPTIVLADFGLARQLSYDADYTASVHISKGYTAPEVLKGESGRPADIYSLGAVLDFLFNDNNPTQSKPSEGRDKRQLPFSKDMDEGERKNITSMINRCKDKDPNVRPSIEELYEFISSCCTYQERLAYNTRYLCSWLEERVQSSYTQYQFFPSESSKLRLLSESSRMKHMLAKCDQDLQDCFTPTQIQWLRDAVISGDYGEKLPIDQLQHPKLTDRTLDIVYYYRRRRDGAGYVGIAAPGFTRRDKSHVYNGKKGKGYFDKEYAETQKEWEHAVVCQFKDKQMMNRLEPMLVCLLGTAKRHRPDKGFNVLVGGDLGKCLHIDQPLV